jgi:SAM-dependent methyltransferase
MPKNFQLSDVREILSGDKKLADFIIKNLQKSLFSIGFSKEFLGDLLSDLGNIDVKDFSEKWKKELQQKFTIGFFQNLVPRYFSKYVVQATPSSGKIIDIGCGTGILAKLYAGNDRFKKVIGIDIRAYPEWELFRNKKIRFRVVKEDEIADFLKIEKPDSITVTWTLHHMEYGEQERYLEYIHENLENGSRVIVLEDSYSADLVPENGADKSKEFMMWSLEQREKIMSVYDWVANRVLAQRDKVPMPCTYRTLEE